MAELLNRKDYFRCEKMACTLSQITCMTRQEQAMAYREYLTGRDMKKKLAYAMCADCKQGRTIKEMVA